MSSRERESVPDGGTNERKGVLSLKFLLESKMCDYQQRSRECVVGCTVHGGHKDMKEQCK